MYLNAQHLMNLLALYMYYWRHSKHAQTLKVENLLSYPANKNRRISLQKFKLKKKHFTFELLRTAKYTEYSKISPWFELGGSHERCAAASADFAIFIADGAPGNPGRQVLNADTLKNKNVF